MSYTSEDFAFGRADMKSLIRPNDEAGLGQNVLSESTVRKYNNGIEDKVYVPRDLEGRIDEKYIEMLRLVESELSAYSWFIGIAPYGSRSKGYSEAGSYIDIHISNEDMIARKVVIRDIPYRCTDYVRDLMKQHRIDDKGRII